MNNKFVDYFQLLEVHMFASEEAIRSAYKRLIVKYHPDNDGNKEKFLLVKEAYKTLINYEQRQEYFGVWKNNMLSQEDCCMVPTKTYEDMAFNKVLVTVNAYMLYLMNTQYKKAYELLCHESQSRIFLRDFIHWQELVSEIHEITKFSSSVDTVELDEIYGTKVICWVKVREYNVLLNHFEEDLFRRVLVFEKGEWKIYLQEINIRQVIKKYKKIVATYKKNAKNKRVNLKNHYVTKFLDEESFVHNLEYEFLRYQRYKRTFGLIGIEVGNITVQKINKVIRSIHLCTRITDSFCTIGHNKIVVLLPETGDRGIKAVNHKLQNIFNKEGLLEIRIQMVIVDTSFESVKEILKETIGS